MLLRFLLVFPLLYVSTCTAQTCECVHSVNEKPNALSDELTCCTVCISPCFTNAPDEYKESFDKGHSFLEQTEKQGWSVPWSKLSINILKKPLYACYTPRSGGTNVLNGVTVLMEGPASGYSV